VVEDPAVVSVLGSQLLLLRCPSVPDVLALGFASVLAGDVLEALQQASSGPWRVVVERQRQAERLDEFESELAGGGSVRAKKVVSDNVIVGSHKGLAVVMDRVRLVAPSDAAVLLLGETGSGKEVVARAIHSSSRRGDGPFVRVNCGAIPPELVDSQLFGHERGAFTGASHQHLGWFERADHGTLLLDEVAELPPAAQVRLLRVLQDGELERVGARSAIRVDCRIIAATNRDLAAMVSQGAFREDLWYRLTTFPILIPPLRDRLEDIPELAAHFAHRAAVRYGVRAVAPSTEDAGVLQSYAWPGNVRELASVINRAVLLGNGASLRVGEALGISLASTRGAVTQPSGETAAPLRLARLDVVLRDYLTAVLQHVDGRIEGKGGAAAILGIHPSTLRSKLRRLDIEVARFRS